MASIRVFGAFLLLALAVPASGEEGPTPVRFEPESGREVKADWFAGGKGMPAILLLAGDAEEAKVEADFAAKRPKGFGALLVPSGPKAASDAAAALRWLREKGEADPARIVILSGPACATGALGAAAKDDAVAGCWLVGSKEFDQSVAPSVRKLQGRFLSVACPKEVLETATHEFWGGLPAEPNREVTSWEGMSATEVMDVLLRGKLAGTAREWAVSAAGREILDGKLDPWETAAFMGDRGVVGRKRAVLHGKDAQARLRWDGEALSFYLEACYPFPRGDLASPNGWFDLRFSGSAVPNGRIRFIGNWSYGGAGQ